MKRVLKFILSLILIAGICGAGWYFLGYKMFLSRDYFMERGATYMAEDNASRAVHYYQYAWDRSPNYPETAMALADAYVLDGNYTKAEYTLVSSITVYPEVVDLYVQLSQVYVAQDKLLDAESMLSGVANQTVKAQLDVLRPKAPTISPDSGYYSDFIDVSLAYDGGTAYMTIDGTYPSTATDVYVAPMTLPDQASTVRAIVVADNGLVSTVAINGYTIGGIVEPYTFQDATVEATVRQMLSKTEGEDVLTSDMWNLTHLELSSDVNTLLDLTVCRSLTSLTIHDVYGIDFSTLGEIPSLQVLDLSNSTVSTKGLTAIATLPNLTALYLSSSGIADATPLAGASSLQVLDLSDNVISDISALSTMGNLQQLNLSNNAILTIDPLAPLSLLTELDVSNNQVVTLSSLESKTNLETLILSKNQIVSLENLRTCTALSYLAVDNNAIADLSPVQGLTQLGTLIASNNQIEILPDCTALTQLISLVVANNQLTDISPLAGLPLLNYVSLDYNAVVDLTPLLTCPAFVMVDAFANPVEGVEELQAASIVVNYDPTYVLPEEETA